jgi:hypothetical protein
MYLEKSKHLIYFLERGSTLEIHKEVSIFATRIIARKHIFTRSLLLQIHTGVGQSQWGFIRVSWALIMLMWHHINEER